MAQQVAISGVDVHRDAVRVGHEVRVRDMVNVPVTGQNSNRGSSTGLDHLADRTCRVHPGVDDEAFGACIGAN
jgi:hypothetical protein